MQYIFAMKKSLYPLISESPMKGSTMNRSLLVSTFISAAWVMSSYATDLAAIISKVSENCDKINSYSADANVRYKI
jgi:hypothetical protein